MEQDQNCSAGPPAQKKYTVRGGVMDLGKDYEFNLATLLFLKCINCGFEDVSMAFNVDGTGAFDDVILMIKKSDSNCVSFMFQLKHNEQSKNIAEHTFLGKQGNFSIPKYIEDIDSLHDSIAEEKKEIFKDLGNNIYFVLFTNRSLPKKISPDNTEHSVTEKYLFLNQVHDEKVMFFDTGKNQQIFKVDTNNNLLDIDQSRAHNYNNFFLFLDQVHFKHSEKLIEKELKKLIDPCETFHPNLTSIARKVINFVRNWSKGNLGGHYYLTRQDVICKITDLCLSKYDINLRREQFMIYNSTEQLNIWHQIVSKPTVTVVDSSKTASKYLMKYICSEVSKYYNGSMKGWDDQFDDDDQRSFYKSHPELKNHMLKIAGYNRKISLFKIYQCIRQKGKIPQVLKIKNISDYEDIRNILKISNNAQKIIVINKAKLMEKQEGINRFETVEDLSNASRALILKQKVNIQGRSSVMLGDLLDAEMFKYLRFADIIHILSGDFSVGAKLAPLPEYFIERFVTKKLIKSEVLQEIHDEIFLLKKHPIDYDRHLPIDQSRICEAEDFDFDNLIHTSNIIWIKDKITDKQRLKLKNINNSAHCLSVLNKNYLEYIWSEGNTNNIERFQTGVKCALKNKISNFFNCPVNIISDAPGMGKSVLMDFVAESAPVTKWILKVNLNEHRQYLRGDHCALASTKAAEHLQYFYQTSKNANTTNIELDDAIFKKLTHTKNVIILLDGFDEVSILYKNEATNIATSLYNEGYYIWLTTRPIMKEHLENNFMTSAISLKPFSIQEQMRFIMKYFDKLRCDSVLTSKRHKTNLKKFAKVLLKAVQKKLNDEEGKFTETPLQIKLLTDVFESECKKSLCTGVVSLNKVFDLVDLYKYFIEKQTGILREKHGEAVMTDHLEYKEHLSLFALKTVFAIDYIMHIKQELDQYYKAKERQYLRLQRNGFMTISRKFEIKFVHDKYAQYLAAEWLATNMCHKDGAIKELAQSLIQRRFQGSYKFAFSIFDRILSKDCLLHTSIINKEFTLVKDAIATNRERINETDQSQRSPLHIIALCGDGDLQTKHNMHELLTTIAPIQNGGELQVELDKLNCSPLDYALANGLPQIAEHLFSVLQPESINTNINVTFQNDYWSYYRSLENKSLFAILLRYLVLKDLMLNKEDGNTKIVDYLSDGIAMHLPDNIKNLTMLQLIRICNKEYNPHIVIGSNLHYQVVFGTRTSVEELLSATTSCVNKPDFDGYTPLHYAVLHGKSDIVELLLSHQEKLTVNKQNKDGNTPLHLAFLNYNQTVITTLLRRRATNANIQNEDGDTALHLYSNINRETVGLNQESFREIVELLYDRGADKDQKNLRGQTAIVT